MGKPYDGKDAQWQNTSSVAEAVAYGLREEKASGQGRSRESRDGIVMLAAEMEASGLKKSH
jgi:hypothetical protein